MPRPSSTPSCPPAWANDVRRGRKSARVGLALLALLAVLALCAWWLLQPQRMGRIVAHYAGQATGLEISIGGVFEYRLAGEPRVVAHDVVVREPGAATPLLTADRILVAAPWRTLRARGASADLSRIEIDGPVLDLPVLQRWLATRPAGAGPTPGFSRGIRISDGRIDGGPWHVEQLDLSIPDFAAGAPVHAHADGRFVSADLPVAFDLRIELTELSSQAAVRIAGDVQVDGGTWRLPADIRLSTRLAPADGGASLTDLRIAADAAFATDDWSESFVIALASNGELIGTTLSLQPASLVLRGQSRIPRLQATGGIVYAQTLGIDLQGELERWPDGWPALPAPLDRITPLPFSLAYDGAPNLGDPLALRIDSDRIAASSRLRFSDITRWLASDMQTNPLPPLQAEARIPELTVAGARLQGITVVIEDDGTAAEADAGDTDP